MQIDIVLKDLNKSEALDAFLMDKMGATIESFMKNDTNGHATIKIEMVRHRTLTRKPSYICEIILKPSYQKRVIKVSKSGEELHAVANEAATALRTILRRRSTRKAQHRRHEHPRELQDLVAS